MQSVNTGLSRLVIGGLVFLTCAGISHAAERSEEPLVKVVDGIVLPRRPVADAVTEAMDFLKKADGAYVPGRMDGELAGYFESAFVNADGTRTDRKLAYPARQHAYFIFTFLRYYAYCGEREWLHRARDLADWNIAHSTPPDAVYANVPYSTWQNGKPGGGRDADAIEPDKAAFLGSGYLAVYEATAESKYLEAARKVAETLASQQREDGSWPFRVVPEDAKILQDLGGAPVFLVEFFERMVRYEDKPAYRRARERALKYMLQTHVEKNVWGTYHEDVRAKDDHYLSAEPMCFTADYLFRQAKVHPEYVEMARRILGRLEERLVHTEGHAAAPAPGVAEQAGFDHIMPGHTARYCLALANAYAATRDAQVRARALSGMHALTFMQAPTGLFGTFFHTVRENAPKKVRPNWYSQHLYTVCHVLEAMPCLPELAPDGQDHIVGTRVCVRDVRYAPGEVQFETIAPSTTTLKLAFVPKVVRLGQQELRAVNELAGGDGVGWSFDPATKLLTIRHDAGRVTVSTSAQ
ncbi:MAG: hypothetical protein JXA69_03760 [Phycisphaerae bacterium]|nr:hypothetical protein [Phycisphaerae bacterium]